MVASDNDFIPRMQKWSDSNTSSDSPNIDRKQKDVPTSSSVGKITLYKGKEVVKKNIDSAIAVDELINLLKESEAWVEV